MARRRASSGLILPPHGRFSDAWNAACEQGRYEEALARFEEAAGKRRTSWVLGHLGFTLAHLGRAQEARDVIAELEKKGGKFEAAVVHAALGEKDLAIAGLEAAVAAFVPSTLWINVDYRLADLRDHPRFPALVTAVGLR
ncbi:MAG: tetratricopeptide repeat protein [Bryobacteraceae bacterium]